MDEKLFLRGHWLTAYLATPRLRASFRALFVLGILATVWWGSHRWYRENLLDRHRAVVGAELAPHASALVSAINQRLGVLRGLKAFVQSHLSEETLGKEFKTFAAALQTVASGIRNFTVAPRGINSYVYPVSGNEVALGHDLIHDSRANVRADVQRAIHSGQIALSGPCELRQGGLGLVARQAVYEGDKLWGLVIIVLDLPPVLEEAALVERAGSLKMALRTGSGHVFAGDPLLFRQSPVIYRVDLPEGFWELAAAPGVGWAPSVRQSLLFFDGAALAIVLLMTALAYLIANRHERLNQLVEERTRDIGRANEQLQRDLTERERIETELHKAQDELEERVRHRTLALQKANEALEAEIEERRRTEQERNLLLTIMQAVSQAEDFHTALKLALREICESTGWDFGEAWVPTPDEAALQLSPAWHGVGEHLERFRKSTTAIRSKTGPGLMVRVWSSKQAEWDPDVSAAAVRAEAARQAGLQAAVGVPIIADDHVQTVLVFFTSASREEDKRLIEVISAVASQLGSLIRRKRAEQALRETERRFQVIFNQTYQFVGLLSADGAVLEANQTALDFIGCKLSDIVGRPFWETPWWDISPETRNRLKNAIGEAAKGTFVRYETEHRRSDSFVSTFDFSLKPVFDQRGQVFLIIPEGRDITDRKLAEEELRRARDELELRVQERTQDLAKTIEQLNAEIDERHRLQEQLIENSRLAAIGTTAAKIAHEIANPLNGMFLTAQRLERQLAQASCLDEGVETTLRRLRDEIRRLDGLLDDFRSISRREKYNFQSTDLTAIAREILATELENYTGRRVHLEQLFPPDLPLVQADPDKLKQALWNLFKNAVEAMPQGGTLTLKAHSTGANVVLEIADTGVGIPPGVDIFEPFTTTKGSGSGLGLMVVRQIVAAHGANITYTTEPGNGTKFCLTLPLQPPACP